MNSTLQSNVDAGGGVGVSPIPPMRSNTCEAEDLAYDLKTWRHELKNETWLRREVDRTKSKNSARWEALWSGWYEVKKHRIAIEERAIFEGGLLCLVAP